jgi:hypothetical protein
MSDWILKQGIDVKCCVKLAKNESDTCALLSEAYRAEAMKKSGVPEWHKLFKEGLHVGITNEDRAHQYLRYQGYVHLEFIPQGQTVNQAYYVEVLKRLHGAVDRKRSELWPNDWIIHHDNAAAHKALSVKQFLVQSRLVKWNTPLFPLILLQITSGSLQKQSLL